jgi:hypothetical protein
MNRWSIDQHVRIAAIIVAPIDLGVTMPSSMPKEHLFKTSALKRPLQATNGCDDKQY